MRKYLIFLICMLLCIDLVGCSKNADKKEITIAMWEKIPTSSAINMYMQTFERENNVKVNYEKIKAPTYEEYLKKLNTKLYLKNGPTLICIGVNNLYKTYIDRGVALEVKDKIPNIDKLYDNFKEKNIYYVPVGMICKVTEIDKDYLKELDLENIELNWTKQDYIKLKEKWLKLQPRPFNYRAYRDIVQYPLKNIDIFDSDTKDIKINADRIKKYIKKAKDQIFSENYALKKGYRYDKYIDFIRKKTDGDIRKLWDLHYSIEDNLLIKSTERENGLKFRNMYAQNTKDMIFLPNVMKNEYQIKTWGFIVNRNGKNAELGCKFINGLLDDEQQIDIYNDTVHGDFPVNKDIEEEIRKIEEEREIEDRFIKLKEYILDKFNKGEYKVYNSQDSKKVEFYNMLEEDLVKIIFDEKEYSDEELSRKLQRLEDKYNMWLTE
ncbi:extracellular solute-binding protein [Dethiothermospora halolimnae]|uniref:extracellular solute-binding protein n=1 Tax=Dethiothermospora halolimnae TaxID=3114390 RepID=UPI003CCB865C